jgi:hypothetical protein
MIRDVSRPSHITAARQATEPVLSKVEGLEMTGPYAELRANARVRECALFPFLRTPSELELQARWFAGDFGTQFVTVRGDKIDIVQFGTWNREAGPDFRDAAISLNGGEPMRGSVEFDLADRNWEAHGHAINPAFEDTVLHVFVDKGEREFFTRTKANREVLQVRVDPNALPESFGANIPLARPGRCQAPLRDLPDDRVNSILDAAALFRLQRKAGRIRRKIESHGRDEALFQELATTLGYKQNKLPFTLLAQRLPLKLLREKIDEAEALLFGSAGFLKTADLDVYQKSTRDYVRQLWDRWWPRRDDFQRLMLPAALWKVSSTRPANHPQRRLGALAAVITNWPTFAKLSRKDDHRALSDFLLGLQHSFWDFHYTLVADTSSKEMALIGESRVAEFMANVYYPLAFAEGNDVWNAFSQLRARLANRPLAIGATRLFGDDPRRGKFLNTVAHQQGLLQIYEDFCLQDNSDCAQCPFPEQMQKWT